ncbi:alkaline phosphatase PhoX [Parasphingorhabdus sp.]|jgi:secreted PhoX family phosphatase|uniref:alkaline phosphatase PhoX n=1 Tax=Parasphingorhabdus sp. TaxID=2709688 RepID=UPI003D26A83E
MTLSRRHFLRQAQAVGLFYASYSLAGCAQAHSANNNFQLIPDPAKRLDLPAGFTYTLVSETGGTMSDGFFRPGRPDGMACFADPSSADKCILMRNHENWLSIPAGSPFGKGNELLDRVSESQLYDRKADGSPFFGGVTKVVYDLKNNRLESDHLVLTGTAANCAGGKTPWGSWLSCEEEMLKPEEGPGKYHGFVFETPANATGLIDAIPLKAMGRFTHEAASVDPKTGIVYMTEDARHGLFYRFIPAVPGQLHEGGRLQALALRNKKSAITSNWPEDWGGHGPDSFVVGQDHIAEWIDLEDVESPNGDLAHRGYASGAAQFMRGEGLDYAVRADGKTGDFYFTCTEGGAERVGQIWRYTPDEGVEAGGTLQLFFESTSADSLDMCDNLVIAPWNDIILCEDGRGDQYLRGLSPEGIIYDIARNAHKDRSEFCGACFSPDGRTMFVNVQEPGYTYAITGPWENLRV